MKPLLKISLFFIGAVFVIFLCYSIIKSTYRDNEKNYAQTPENNNLALQEETINKEQPEHTSNLVEEPINDEVSNEDPYIELEPARESVYFMTCVDGYVTVLYPDLNTIFFETGIFIDDLPYEIRESIIEGRIMNSVEEIYNFLESYTS